MMVLTSSWITHPFFSCRREQALSMRAVCGRVAAGTDLVKEIERRSDSLLFLGDILGHLVGHLLQDADDLAALRHIALTISGTSGKEGRKGIAVNITEAGIRD